MDQYRCLKCNLVKSSKLMYIRPNRNVTRCNMCHNICQRANYLKYKEANPFKQRCVKIKATAKYKKLDFNLTPEYLVSLWTGKCAITGVPIVFDQRDSEHAAELDRLIPEKGYITGNVSYISRRINRIKNNASTEEIKLLLKFLEKT